MLMLSMVLFFASRRQVEPAVLYNFTEYRCSSARNTVQQQPCSLEEGKQSQLVIETGLNYYSYHLLFLLLGSI